MILWAIKTFPFFYTAMFIVVFAIYNFASEGVVNVLDALFYVSPIVIFAHIVYSYVLHLCKWHRIACAIPIIPQIVNAIDVYIYEFTQDGLLVVYMVTLGLVVLYLIAVYKVFFTDEGRIC